MFIDSTDLRQKAFEQFRETAKAEHRDFVYTLSYRRLVPEFSTAPPDKTQRDLKTIEDMARLGHGDAAIEMGQALFNWARDNGYQQAAP